MTRAGCLVFAHRSGGTPEVINEEDALLWTTEEDAVNRIGAAASVEVDQLRARLCAHAQSFAAEAFVEHFREIVAGFR
jgi:hypothetical protein